MFILFRNPKNLESLAESSFLSGSVPTRTNVVKRKKSDEEYTCIKISCNLITADIQSKNSKCAVYVTTVEWQWHRMPPLPVFVLLDLPRSTVSFQHLLKCVLPEIFYFLLYNLQRNSRLPLQDTLAKELCIRSFKHGNVIGRHLCHKPCLWNYCPARLVKCKCYYYKIEVSRSNNSSATNW